MFILRKTLISLSLMVASVTFLSLNVDASTISAVGLKAEHQVNPIGVDCVPQLSWMVLSDADACLQSAYRIIVASSAELLDSDKGDLWDSGKVLSNRTSGINPDALVLNSRCPYYWKVKVWNQDGVESEWSEKAFFETGLVKDSDWQGGWIGYVPGMPGRILYFKASNYYTKKIVKARAYVAGIGYSDLYINGKKVGDHVLDPAQSNYTKRIYYVAYDIKDYIQDGANSFVIPVAPGWLGTPRLRAQVEVFFDDGTYNTMVTDNFRNVTTGPSVYSTVFDGEKYDAREENEDIWKPGVPGGLMNKDWAWAHNTDDPSGKMMWQKVEPIKVVETTTPRFLGEPAPGVYVFDAGRNLAGWVAFKAKGNAGDVMTIKFAETVRDNGFINQDNLRNAKSMDTYVFKGEETEEWEPSFTYHGFRYFQVEGLSYKPSEEDFSVKAVRSSVERVSTFECSNPLLNDINTMVIRTEANNLHSVPTDCPQRDERMGWLNDMTVRIEQAMYNFDMALFYSKFIEDVTDTEDEDGRITCVAPFRFGMRPADPVSASYLIMAKMCYEFYADTKIIERNYDGMKGWVNYLASRTEDGIVNYSYYGDWCPPRDFLMDPNGSGVSRDTPGILMSTGYLYLCARMLSQMAGVLGNSADESLYADLAEKTAKAFNDKWWNEDLGGYAANNQACNSFALYLGIVSEDRIPRVVENLVADVKAHDYHLTTGNLCTKYLLEMLTEYGHVEEAYRIASQKTYPSWGFMLENGATALWERWEYLTGDAMNSHDHPMMGSVGSWFEKYLVGIRPDFDDPGFGHFTVRPYIPSDLSYAKGSLKTVKGVISSSWRKSGKTLVLDVEVPAGSTATVGVPGRKGYTFKEVGSGKHRFTGRL